MSFGLEQQERPQYTRVSYVPRKNVANWWADNWGRRSRPCCRRALAEHGLGLRKAVAAAEAHLTDSARPT